MPSENKCVPFFAFLYLGAAFDETRAFTAHAWLRCGPFYATGGMGYQQYGVLTSYAETAE